MKMNLFKDGMVGADRMIVDCVGSETVFDLLLNLQAACYPWDLPFPTTYQLPAFFQVHVLKDNCENALKRSAFSKLVKALGL